MPAITRVLSRDGQELRYEVSEAALTVSQTGKKPVSESFDQVRAAAERLIELSRAKLQQGWAPAGEPARVSAFIRSLEEAGIRSWQWVVALSEAELREAYAARIKKGGKDLTIEVLRRRPTRELFAFMLTRFDEYYEEDWTKAVKFLGKDPAQAVWIAEELANALRDGKLPTERARKFAQRNQKKLTAGPKPEPVAPVRPAGNEGDLLQAIARAPEDDAPRLVYGDWLLERGIGWGELIQVSCQLEQLEPGDPRRPGLLEQLKRLEKKHSKAWLEPIRPFIRSWSIERGLLSRVTCDAALFTQAAEAIALRAPRAYLELTGLKKKTIPALAKTPLGSFGIVNLSSQRIDDEGMSQLAASASLHGVTMWHLGYNGFGDAGLQALAGSPHFGSTVDLYLEAFRPSFGAEGLRALLASPHLRALRSLVISVEAAWTAFASAAVELEHFSLSVAHFDDADAEALASAPALAGLISLSINRATEQQLALTEAGVGMLLGALRRLRSFQTSIPLSPALTSRIARLSSAPGE